MIRLCLCTPTCRRHNVRSCRLLPASAAYDDVSRDKVHASCLPLLPGPRRLVRRVIDHRCALSRRGCRLIFEITASLFARALPTCRFPFNGNFRAVRHRGRDQGHFCTVRINLHRHFVNTYLPIYLSTYLMLGYARAHGY